MCRLFLLAPVALLLLSGCEQGPKTIPVYKCTGTVTVDGQPAFKLQIEATRTGGPKLEMLTASMCETNLDGKFALSTFVDGDGLPEGEYVLTFKWQEFNMISMQYGGPDKLNGRYADPAKSTFKVKVEKGKPLEPLSIALTTK